jgi:hypothetical protein
MPVDPMTGLPQQPPMPGQEPAPPEPPKESMFAQKLRQTQIAVLEKLEAKL